MSPALHRLLSLIAIIAVAGVVVSSVSLQHHFGTSKTEFCDIGESFNCDIVNRSIYSEIFGIPVALIGMAGYGVVAALATARRDKKDTPWLLLLGALAGLAFALRLTYIEARMLGVWCVMCLCSLALITGITILSLIVWVKSRSTNTG